MENQSGSVPISAQFAKVLVQDIAEFVHTLAELSSPKTNQLVVEARQQMELDGVIHSLSDQVLGSGKMVAVDGGNNVLNIGSGCQCFILAVSYSLRPGIDPKFKMKRICFEETEPSGLIYGVRNAMELALISGANESESFCIVDNSWVSLLQTVNRTIDHYKKASDYDRAIIMPFLNEMLDHNGDFIKSLQNSRNIAISKSGVSNYYAKKYTLDQLTLADKLFLLGILEAGEYTRPQALSQSAVGQLNVHPEFFKTKDQVHQIYNATLASTGQHGLCLTYFKPHEWSPVKRIEFHKSLLQQEGKREYLTNAVSKNTQAIDSGGCEIEISTALFQNLSHILLLPLCS